MTNPKQDWQEEFRDYLDDLYRASAVPSQVKFTVEEANNEIIDFVNSLLLSNNKRLAEKEWTIKCLAKEIQSQVDDASLRLDIFGMAFYRDTGIWPLFKSAPPELMQGQRLSDEERMKAFNDWMASLSASIIEKE